MTAPEDSATVCFGKVVVWLWLWLCKLGAENGATTLSLALARKDRKSSSLILPSRWLAEGITIGEICESWDLVEMLRKARACTEMQATEEARAVMIIIAAPYVPTPHLLRKWSMEKTRIGTSA